MCALVAIRCHFSRQDILNGLEACIDGPVKEVADGICRKRKPRSKVDDHQDAESRNRQRKCRLPSAKLAANLRAIHTVGNVAPDRSDESRANIADGYDKASCSNVDASECREEEQLPRRHHREADAAQSDSSVANLGAQRQLRVASLAFGHKALLFPCTLCRTSRNCQSFRLNGSLHQTVTQENRFITGSYDMQRCHAWTSASANRAGCLD